jgi:type IV secretory pathway VirB2 component (pilin)
MKNAWRAVKKMGLSAAVTAPGLFIMVFFAVLAMVEPAFAKSKGIGQDVGSFGDVPTIDYIVGFFQGPLVKLIAIGGIVVGGIGLAFGEGGGFRTAMFILAGVAFIMAAGSIVSAVSGLSIAF